MSPANIRERALKNIVDLSAWFVQSIKHSNAMDFYDINLIAEDILVPIFKEIYGYEDLANLNAEQGNFPGIDLGDPVEGFAIQVTSTATTAKITHTLKKYAGPKNELYKQYRRLIVFNITEKQQVGPGKKLYPRVSWPEIIAGINEQLREDSKKESVELEEFTFSKTEDIRDFTDLLRDIRAIESVTKIQAIEQIFLDNFGGVHDIIRPPETINFSLIDLTGIRNFLINYLGTEAKAVPFGGRQNAFEALEKWRTQSAKNFLLLATPAGRGKSALFTHWAQLLSGPGWKKKAAVIFAPISIRFNSNLPEKIFPYIAFQLALLFGEKFPSDMVNTPPGFWQNLVSSYLRRALPDGRQLLLILDGLDEAAWDIGRDLFPLDLPASNKVAISARYLAGDVPGPRPWLRKLGWGRFDVAQTLELQTLSQAGVKEILLQSDTLTFDAINLDALAAQLFHLTKGDPLLVELYIDWLEDNTPGSVQLQTADLEQIEPDYNGFFAYWWEEQEKLWAQREQSEPMAKQLTSTLLTSTLLYILAIAEGPLTITDIKALLPPDLTATRYQIKEATKPLHRLIIGDGESAGYTFSHTRLSDFIAAEFLDEHERRQWRDAFVTWGRGTIEQLQSAAHPAYDQVSRYLLQYYSRHLQLADATAGDYLPLLSWAWIQSWHRYSGAYTGFLRDVGAALQAFNAFNKQALAQGQPVPYAGWQLLGTLCHISINNLSANISTDLLVALRKYDLWTDEQVLAYARQKQDPSDRARTLSQLAPNLSIGKQQGVYQEALSAAQAIAAEWLRASFLTALAPQLPEKVYEAAQAIADEGKRARVLTALAPQLPEDEREEVLNQALQAAQAITDEWSRARVLTELVPQLPEDEREELLNQALQAAQAITDEVWRANVLTALAPQLPEDEREEVLNQALQAAQAITDEWSRASVLTALASQLPEDEREELLNQALQAAQAIAFEWERASVLTALAPQLPEDEREEVLYQALQAARAITHEWSRASVLTALAPHLPEKVYEAAQAIADEGWRASVLTALAPQLPEDEREEVLNQALQAAQAIADEGERAGVLTALAPQLPEDEREELLNQALQAAQAITDEGERAGILNALAPQLPEDEREELLNQALQAAQAIVDEGERAGVLTALAPQLPEDEREELLNQALQAVQAIADEGLRARVLTALAPQLPEKVYEAAQAIADERSRARVLTALAPQLPEKVYEAAQAIAAEGSRASVLTALAPYIPEKVAAAVQEFIHAENRISLLIILAGYLATLPRPQIYDMWLLFLSFLLELKRSDALEAVAGFLPVIQALGDEEALDQTLTAVQKVSRWWP